MAAQSITGAASLRKIFSRRWPAKRGQPSLREKSSTVFHSATDGLRTFKGKCFLQPSLISDSKRPALASFCLTAGKRDNYNCDDSDLPQYNLQGLSRYVVKRASMCRGCRKLWGKRCRYSQSYCYSSSYICSFCRAISPLPTLLPACLHYTSDNGRAAGRE